MSKQKKFEENLAELETIVQVWKMVKLLWKMRLLPFKRVWSCLKNSKRRWTRLKKTLVKVMQEDGTESDFE